MLSEEARGEIRRLFYAEHMSYGAIATHLKIHHQTVRRVINPEASASTPIIRSSLLDGYKSIIEEKLDKYPRITAPRLMQILRGFGYRGGITILRNHLAKVRPKRKKGFLPIASFPGVEAQVDWGSFGTLTVGKATRKLSCFAMVLTHSRALFARFFFDQSAASLVSAHVHAFNYFAGVTRRIRYDNMKSVVLDRYGSAIRYHSLLLELAGHYHFEPSVCNPYAPHEKGKVERSIRYIRDNFFVGRQFRNLDDANEQLTKWLDQIAQQRSWPEDRSRSVAELFLDERSKLLRLRDDPFHAYDHKVLKSGKFPYIRYDLNDYSIPLNLVQVPLDIYVNEQEIKICQEDKEICRHPRSYAKGERVNISEHLIYDGVSEARQVIDAQSILVKICPESEQLFLLMLEQGVSVNRGGVKLLMLIKEWGEKIVAEAIATALARNCSQPHVISQLCGVIAEKKQISPSQLPLTGLAHSYIEKIKTKQHQLSDYQELILNPKDES